MPLTYYYSVTTLNSFLTPLPSLQIGFVLGFRLDVGLVAMAVEDREGGHPVPQLEYSCVIF